MTLTLKIMKDITVIIPIHEINAEYTEMLQKAVNNVSHMEYDGTIKTIVVKPSSYDDPYIKCDKNTKFINNDGLTDYCSQINFGVKHVDTEYFSILEVDDRYNKKWFKMFDEYLNSHENVSVFLPINVIHNVKTNEREFVNDIIWASSFSDEIGFIDFECLQNYASFNLTGGIFKTSDWLGYKPSIKEAFNYEYLLRATNPKNKSHSTELIYVIPKEGYYHELFREGSLINKYLNDISNEETEKWYELAKREYVFSEDRNKTITSEKAEIELK